MFADIDFSQVRMVATDMDGTLLNSEGKVNEEFFGVFRALKEKGIKFTVASGRQYPVLRELLHPIRDELSYIAENGSVAVENDEVLFSKPLDAQTVSDLIETGRKTDGAYLLLGGRETAYIDSREPEFLEQVKKYFASYQVVDDLHDIRDREILKFTVCNLKGAQKVSYPAFEKYTDRLQVKVSSPIWMDITDLDANKGVALQALLKNHDVTPEQTMAFGDYHNDIEMLRSVKYSFAMANAQSEVKAVAQYETKSNDELGVTFALKALLSAIENNQA
ncbi:haloacid dehalogenase [Fulvitalea axinellae]|uniref:Haloacid dehalogenase n=1 Tax=Fulvitalea axinellae TaxID=1182444 RepID=A0AAU9CEB2_9BACT|nr:haloacid dehalogenase [Fulvitalea axinellae]